MTAISVQSAPRTTPPCAHDDPGSHGRPGLSARRLARLVEEACRRCALDLTGVRVLTEAATGPYAVTPVLAAFAGAEVIALTRATSHGCVDDVVRATRELARHLGVEDRIAVAERRSRRHFAWADAITNSGHVRPVVGEFAGAIRSGAAFSLMFESWELGAGRHDVDLDALLGRGVRVAGTNERHPDVDVFSYLGPMAVAQLADAGVSAYGGRIAVLCDNPFWPYLVDGLRAAGATVRWAADLPELLTGERPEALVVARTPTGRPVLDGDALDRIAQRWPDVVLAQFWGDLDRHRCGRAGLSVWPPAAPAAGHMGVLPSRVGPEPIVALQAGGLKVAQVLLTPEQERSPADLAYLDPTR